MPPSVKIFASCVNTHQRPSAPQLFGIFSMSDAVWRRWVLSADRSPVRPRGGGRASLLGDSWRNHSPHCSVWGRSSSFWDLRSYHQVILSVKYSSYVWKEADMSTSSKGSEPWSDLPGSCGKIWSPILAQCLPTLHHQRSGLRRVFEKPANENLLPPSCLSAPVLGQIETLNPGIPKGNHLARCWHWT